MNQKISIFAQLLIKLDQASWCDAIFITLLLMKLVLKVSISWWVVFLPEILYYLILIIITLIVKKKTVDSITTGQPLYETQEPSQIPPMPSDLEEAMKAQQEKFKQEQEEKNK